LADDLGWGDVGYHGSSIKTPNIDQLTTEGIELNRFYTAAGGVRVPAIIKWPKGFKGIKKTDQVMGFVDVMPTLLDIIDSKAPLKNELDGISVKDVLIGKKAFIPRNLFLGSGAIINHDWKLIEASSLNPKMKINEDQFFHISMDVSEKNNVKEQYLEEYKVLKKELIKYRTIQTSQTVSPYHEGRESFIAPKNWQITN